VAKPDEFWICLRLFREERTLSLRELSTLSGVDHAYIHRLESGDKTAPSPDVSQTRAWAQAHGTQAPHSGAANDGGRH